MSNEQTHFTRFAFQCNIFHLISPDSKIHECYWYITLPSLQTEVEGIQCSSLSPLGFGCPLKHAVIDNCYKLGRAWLGCSWQSCAFCLEISHSIMLHEKLCFSPGDLLPLLCLLRPSVHLSIMPSWQRMDSFCPSETRSSCVAACAEANSVSSVGLIRCWCHFKRCCLEQQLLVMIHALFHINIIQNI